MQCNAHALVVHFIKNIIRKIASEVYNCKYYKCSNQGKIISLRYLIGFLFSYPQITKKPRWNEPNKYYDAIYYLSVCDNQQRRCRETCTCVRVMIS